MSQSDQLRHLAPLLVREDYIPEERLGLRQRGALLVPPSTELPPDDLPKSLARRLVEQELSTAIGREAAATSLLVERIYVGLSRWFGPYGALALVTRAVSRARAEHALLADVAVSASDTPHVTGWTNGSTAEESLATTEAAIAVLTSLHESLSRLIGDDLAETLLTQHDVVAGSSTTEMPVSPNASGV